MNPPLQCTSFAKRADEQGEGGGTVLKFMKQPDYFTEKCKDLYYEERITSIVSMHCLGIIFLQFKILDVQVPEAACTVSCTYH